jgi:uncharacterized protein (TIGR02266 family)
MSNVRKSPDLETLLFEEEQQPEEAGFTVVEGGEAPAPALVVREERALVALEVSFATPRQAVEAYTETVGVSSIAVLTNHTMKKGTELTVRLSVPGWPAPVQASGKVTWSRPDAMGIAFTDLKADQKQRLQQMVLENTTLMERMKRQLSRQVERPVAASVRTLRTTLLQLQDELFSDVVAELLNQNGFVAVTDALNGSRPNVIVAEPDTLGPLVAAYKTVPLVVVNASGPNDMAKARLPYVRARAYVARPASAAKVFQAIQRVFSGF